MPRSRMIKPEFFDDEKLSEISRDARLLFTGLWVNSDDYGVVKGNHKWLKSKIFPYDDISPKQFTLWMRELEKINCILGFKANGESYYYIRTFSEHQTINKPSQARNPTPPEELLHQCYTTTVVLPSETETETETETEYIRASELHENVLTTKKRLKKPDNGYSEDFEQFWSAIIHRPLDRKADAYKHWKRKTNIPPIQDLLGIVRRYNDSKNGTDPEHILATYNWLKNELYLQNKTLSYKPETDRCANHPEREGNYPADGKTYCLECINAIENKIREDMKRPETKLKAKEVSETIKNLAASLKIQ